MKLKFVIPILLIFSSSQLNAQCDIEELITLLDSEDYSERFFAARTIGECNLIEALNEIETRFDIEEKLIVKSEYLYTLYQLGEEEINMYCENFIGSVDKMENKSINPFYAKFLATYLLLNNGVYSHYEHVFNLLDQNFDEINSMVIFALGDIVDNVPDQEEAAKQWLLNISINGENELDRSLAIEILLENYGNNLINHYLSIYNRDLSYIVRMTVLESLSKINYSNLHSFLTNNFT